jgi:hypothetical protein
MKRTQQIKVLATNPLSRLDWRHLIDLLCCFQKTLLSFGVVSAFVLLGEFMHYTKIKDSMKDGWRSFAKMEDGLIPEFTVVAESMSLESELCRN